MEKEKNLTNRVQRMWAAHLMRCHVILSGKAGGRAAAFCYSSSSPSQLHRPPPIPSSTPPTSASNHPSPSHSIPRTSHLHFKSSNPIHPFLLFLPHLPFLPLLHSTALPPQMGCSHSTVFDPDPFKNTHHKKSSGTLSLHSACREVKRGVEASMGVLGRRKSRAQRRRDEDGWLLAHSDEHLDPQSVHSSFRFTLGSSSSQHELEPSSSLNSPSGAAATVLMMNLETGSPGRPDRRPCLKLQVVESLERSISPAAAAAALVRFSYGEIRLATNGFSTERVLGRGALSCVFKGRLRLGRTVAIKRLNNEDKESPKAFCRELMIAGLLDHPNVVPLIGFCFDQAGLFLVYKYVSGGSLEQHLHDGKRGSKSTLSWPARYKIAIGVAQALAYLHYGTKKCVIHRDIKPSNILLSSKMTPKLCDFGLATVTAAPSAPFLCKTVKGTFGYLAPEYFQHGKVSDRTDVYAFGVVLLELITGRKPINTKGSQGEENMVCWAKLRLQQEDSVADLLDPQLKHGSYNRTQLAQMARAASSCLNADESHRPTIDKVLAILQGSEHFTPCKSSFLAKASFSCYPHLHSEQAKCEMSSHLALAMMGVNDVDDEDIFQR
ncbi:hypothetical protein ACLOJK_007235 [Asimina triloba]